jgi:dTDP-4-amino-4,6-dideoxy-D-galactose acyltransferase
MTEVRLLDWDSRFFGIPIGRVDFPPDRLNPGAIASALRAAENMKLACLYLQMPFVSPEVTAFCARPDFLLVDIKTVLSKRPASEAPPEEPGWSVVTPEEAHHPVLEDITEAVSQTSRFRFDPRFGMAGAARLYRTWLRNSLEGGFVSDFLVAAKDGRAEGFITLRTKDGAPHIDLLGVAGEARGRGVGGRLIRAAEARVKTRGGDRLNVVTQGHNIAALRTYQAAGFRIVSQNLFYHVWVEP